MSAETKQDGGPAFPVLEEYSQFNDDLGRYDGHYAPRGGMSLRDYFAAKSMHATISKVAAIANVPFSGAEIATVEVLHERYEAIARSAYEMADAMLKERTK